MHHVDSLGIKLWLDEKNELRYRAPKNQLTAMLRGEILDRKSEIVTFLAQAGAVTGKSIAEESIRPHLRAANTPLPLSFAQQRLWFLTQLDGANPVYNIPVEYRLDGPLNLAALRTALREVEERHEALRTSFSELGGSESGGQAHQQINPAGASFEFVDLTALPAERRDDEVARLSRRAASQIFDLKLGPLWSVQLVRLGFNSHVLLMPMHHIISDHWSLGILLRDLSAFYCRYLGEPCQPLPELKVQYADFAIWQRHWLSGERARDLLAYWKAHLAGAPPLLTLPSDYSRPAVQSDHGSHFYFALSKAITQNLKQLSLENNATLFMTLEAAFAVLLGRYAGQDDVLVGTPIANRPTAETEELIGLFLNAIVLRNDLSGNPTFREQLARVRRVALAAYQRQALPFEMLVEALQPERSLAHSPVFQVMFNLLSQREGVFALPGVKAQRREADYPVAKHDIILTMQETDDGLAGAFEYNTGLFMPKSIERMAAHFITLLEGVAASPDELIGKLPLLTASERGQLQAGWSGVKAPHAASQCYHQAFETIAAAAPDSVAVLHGPSDGSELTGRLTYHEVNERANQLAHRLRELGVGQSDSVAPGAEELVGVYMDRSPETVVSLLAIFKAGGAYVPLDPSLPPDRLAYMLAKSDPRVIITKRTYAASLHGHRARLVHLDPAESTLGVQSALSAQSKRNPVNRSTPANLAYVLFTSGSTGSPKGVMVEQRGMMNNLYAKIADHGITSSDKVAQTAPPSFDISVWQFLAALLAGGTVRIFDDEVARDPAKLLRQTEQERITILEVVPSLFRFMLDELAQLQRRRPALRSLRWLSLTGEALPASLCNAWLALYPGIPILNAYGPAECSDDATHCLIDSPLAPGLTTAPIGKPLPNVHILVLDRNLQFVPAGVAGELYVGGIGVGRGYWKDPDRTRDSFLTNPFAGGSDNRLYKTGDSVRYRSDGTLEFLGRLDHQVKLRGFRIELGEIEAVLRQCSPIEEAVCAIQPSAAGGEQLVAYVTLHQNHSPAPETHRDLIPQWRTSLNGRLPHYMVPANFVVLEQMPLTPNGKLDRQRLPVPDFTPQSSKREQNARTETEEAFVSIWQEVLRVPQVGIHDNFFEVGGHSLLATQVVSRIHARLHVELPLRRLFELPTIAELAEHLETKRVSRQLQMAVPAGAPREEFAL